MNDLREFRLENVGRRAFECLQILDQLDCLISAGNLAQTDKDEIKDLCNKFDQNLAFLNDKRAVRLVKKRQTKRSKSNKVSADNFYDNELARLLDSFKRMSDPSKSDKKSSKKAADEANGFDEHIEAVQSRIDDIKEITEFAKTLKKFLSIKQQHYNSQISSSSEQEALNARLAERHVELDGLSASIDAKRQIYDQEKKELLDKLNQSKVQAQFVSDEENQKMTILKRRLRCNLFGPSEFNLKHISSPEELLMIRYEWDQWATINSTRRTKASSVPVAWVYPNEAPNHEWAQFFQRP